MIILAWTIIQSCLKLYSVFYANASSCIELGFDSAVVLLITMVMERVVPGILLVMVGCIWDWKQKSQLFIAKKLVSSCYVANDAALSTFGNIVQQLGLDITICHHSRHSHLRHPKALSINV